MFSIASATDLRHFATTGLYLLNDVHYQETPADLVQETLALHEGQLSDTGALVIETGKFTGRCPKDKFIIYDDISKDAVDWNDFNQPLDEKYFHIIHKQMKDHLDMRPDIWIRDCYACASPQYRLNVRVVTENPWMNLFAYNMFLRPEEDELDSFVPEWHVLCAPDLQLNAEECGIKNSNTAVISFAHKTVLIAGTGYTGEIKKGIFSVLNFLMPSQKNVLSMHCSANIGDSGDVALFFGLSGTGKTTLSADPSRQLIGDDEHGWSNDGVFNFEGGCYAKCIGLCNEKEPEIFNAIKHGALVENIRFIEGTNSIDFNNSSITENTRVSYPLDYINNAVHPSVGGIPNNIFFLTCDAYGVLPPVSKLTAAQAMYQFISGYTAKVAGTETGVKEPSSTFSACFGAPFLPLHPGKYAAMLGERLKQHNVKVWMINTGWTGGPYGTGKRIDLALTRKMIATALNGSLDNVEYHVHPVFGMQMPLSCPGVPSEILDPVNTWQDSQAYSAMANKLTAQFIKNFEKYASGVSNEIIAAGPTLIE